MANFRQQLFLQFASQGLQDSIEAFQTTYQPKKENRFHLDEITYEIGAAKLNGDAIEFEISSKIPQDEMADRDDFVAYFTAIKTFLADDSTQPDEIDMDNIVQDLIGEEAKERDYVRLLYRYAFAAMYDDAAVGADVVRVQQGTAAHTIPDVPNVNTLAGRVVLVHVGDFTRQEATTRMQRLIEANQAVRQNVGLRNAVTSSAVS